MDNTRRLLSRKPPSPRRVRNVDRRAADRQAPSRRSASPGAEPIGTSSQVIAAEGGFAHGNDPGEQLGKKRYKTNPRLDFHR